MAIRQCDGKNAKDQVRNGKNEDDDGDGDGD